LYDVPARRLFIPQHGGEAILGQIMPTKAYGKMRRIAVLENIKRLGIPKNAP
jgi:hypothetical protein